MRLFSYVVDHDEGHAPNPYCGFCTLCRCKFREAPGDYKNVVEVAQPGDWVIGTGGANPRKSAGRGRLVYAMQVEKKITRKQYYDSSRFESGKPQPNGNYDQQQGDNETPKNSFEEQQQFVLISRHRFYYSSGNAIRIPLKTFPGLEKKGRGFKYKQFDSAYIARFVKWITKHKTGKNGEACMKGLPAGRKTKLCKSSC